MCGLLLSPAVPSVTTPLVSSKDAEPPPVFGASHMPPLQLKGMPLPVQPGASSVEEKAPVAPLGPTSTTSRSVLPDPLADVGGGAGGDEEAMEETGTVQILLCVLLVCEFVWCVCASKPAMCVYPREREKE